MKTESLVAFVMARWLETGEALSAQEIADGMGASIAAVRRILSDKRGFCPSELQRFQTTRESHSKNYTGMSSGAHRLFVYEPSREALRTALRAARGMK